MKQLFVPRYKIENETATDWYLYDYETDEAFGQFPNWGAAFRFMVQIQLAVSK
jgi:hypothetical protein